ncbi:hypothetical protein DQD26_22730 [Salmonella enterica subsp. enterica serovar Ibadan]|nr:hypothetical protein [Salmonella enterica subsp. enterica serovar Ibadan]
MHYLPAGVASPHIKLSFFEEYYKDEGKTPEEIKQITDDLYNNVKNNNVIEMFEKEDGKLISTCGFSIDIHAADIPASILKGNFSNGGHNFYLTDHYIGEDFFTEKFMNYAMSLKNGGGVWAGIYYIIDKQLSGEYKVKP